MTAAPIQPASTVHRPITDAMADRRRAAADRRREEALAALRRRVMPLPGRPLHAVAGRPVGYPGRPVPHSRIAVPGLASISELHPARELPVEPDFDQPALTDREVEVLRTWLLVDSKSSAAHELGISLGTVNTHLTRIRAKYAKVGRTAATKAALVARAVQDDIMSLDEL